MDSVTDRASRTTSFTYNELKQLIVMEDPEGGRTVYGYHPNGTLKRFTDPEYRTTRFDYDLDNRCGRPVEH